MHLELLAGCHSLEHGCASQPSSEGQTSPIQLTGQPHLEQMLQEMLLLPLFVSSSVAQRMLKEGTELPSCS